MPLEPVVLIPNAPSAACFWLPDDRERWRAYLDTDDELIFYCAQCFEREFSDSADSAESKT